MHWIEWLSQEQTFLCLNFFNHANCWVRNRIEENTQTLIIMIQKNYAGWNMMLSRSDNWSEHVLILNIYEFKILESLLKKTKFPFIYISAVKESVF